jgi:hypothetical protein
VNVRQFTPEGTFAALRQHLPRLEALGADVLWLMPVQPIGKKNRKGPLGSYYSIADYTAVKTEFGTAADFRRAMLDLKEKQPALANGAAGGEQARLRTGAGERVHAYTRTKGPNTVLVAVNFGDSAADVAYEGLAAVGEYRDWFDQSSATLGASGRLTIPAHGYRVLVR